jgi:hypothetical protein
VQCGDSIVTLALGRIHSRCATASYTSSSPRPPRPPRPPPPSPRRRIVLINSVEQSSSDAISRSFI